jgi:hypothetical protein
LITITIVDNLKKKYEKQDKETNLKNTVEFIEKLYKEGFHESTLRISEDLFKVIFEDIHNRNILSSTFIGDLEIYGNSLLAGTDFTNELSNLKRVERLYDDIFNTILLNTQKPKHRLSSFLKKFFSKTAENESSDNNLDMSSVLNCIIFQGTKNEKQIVLNSLRYIRFFNTRADILITLSSYIDKSRNLSLAKNALSQSEQLFKLANSYKYLDECVDFKLQKVRYLRLKGEFLHEKSRIESADPCDYKNETNKVEEACKGALMVFFSDNKGNLINQLDIWNNPFSGVRNDSSLTKELSEIIKNNEYYYYEENIKQYTGDKNDIDKILKEVRMPKLINPEDIRERFLAELFTELKEVYQNIAFSNIRYIGRVAETKNQSDIVSQDRNIKLAFSRIRALQRFELSWKHSINLYDNMGIYYTEKGRYLSLSDKKQAALLYKAAIHFHRLTKDYLKDPSLLHSQIENDDKPDKEFEENSIPYIRNVIGLGRAYQCLYCNSNDQEKNESNFQQAKHILTNALKLVTQTDNFIYRARIHEYLGSLYKEKIDYQDAAIISYRISLSVFFKDRYKSYHDKIITDLAKFYATIFLNPSILLDQQTRIVFGKLMNLCENFDTDKCLILKEYRRDNVEMAFKEMFDRFPDDCSRVLDCPHWKNFA